MALAANTVFEVRNVADWSGAADTNGGGYVAGASGTDYSYASIPANGSKNSGGSNGSTTDAVAVGTGVITSVTASFTSAIVGNIIYLQGGTGSLTAGWYQVITYTSATSITVDRNVATGTGITMNIGGCLATPGQAAALMTVVGMQAWIKYSTTAFNLTTSTAGSGGPLSVTVTTSAPIQINGYDQTRGDYTGNRPTIGWASVSAPGGATAIIAASGTGQLIVNNLLLDGNNKNNVIGINGSRVQAWGSIIQNFKGTGGIGIEGGNIVGSAVDNCQINGCTTGINTIENVINSDILNCTTAGTVIVNIKNTLIRSNTNGINYQGMIATRCTGDSNTNYTFNQAYPNNANLYESCIISNTTGGGTKGIVLGVNDIVRTCAFYNNALNYTASTGNVLNPIQLTADPYVNRLGGDFRPNNTAGGGALLRGASTGVFGQTDNQDIGAVQSTPSAGGGGMLVHPGMTGGVRG